MDTGARPPDRSPSSTDRQPRRLAESEAASHPKDGVTFPVTDLVIDPASQLWSSRRQEEPPMDGKLLDGALIDTLLAHLFARVLAAFEAAGIGNVAAQELIVVATFGTLLWGLWRVSRLGYRVNEAVGVVLEVLTVGAGVTLLAITIPAWAAYRPTWPPA